MLDARIIRYQQHSFHAVDRQHGFVDKMQIRSGDETAQVPAHPAQLAHAYRRDCSQYRDRGTEKETTKM